MGKGWEGEIGRELVKAIKESKISIPIFSKKYTSCKWCLLRELQQMVECRIRMGQNIFLIFYFGEPSDVRNQRGSYEEAFRQHHKNVHSETVRGWKVTLIKVGELKGLQLNKYFAGHEGKLVKIVVEILVKKLKKAYTVVPEKLVPVSSPNGKSRQYSIETFQKGPLLGRGSFGSVYKGFTDNGDFCAVKEVSLLDKGERGQQSILQLEQEISLLSRFKHENIVQYLGTAKDEASLYIFLELVATGSLLSLLGDYNLRDSQASSYTRQILNGLKYLHMRNVVHRDIKCANILVDASGCVKVADFGLAKILDDKNSCKGTPFWMAPEVVNLQKNGYGLAADIWSLGCTVLEMLTGKHPYHDLEWQQALYRIARGVPPSVPDSLSLDARDFIDKCLQANPDNRPTAAQLLEYPFVKNQLQTSS